MLNFRWQRQLPRTHTINFRRDGTLPAWKNHSRRWQGKCRSEFSNQSKFMFTRSRMMLQHWRQGLMPRTLAVIFGRESYKDTFRRQIIAGDDQEGYWSNKILQISSTFLRVRDRDICFMADRGFWRSLKRHVADVKNIVGDDQVT